jgi:alkylation response protein AidB-like acyl-CoA dehydrogenase
MTAKLNPWTEQGGDDRLAGAVARLSEADGPADLAGAWPDQLWQIVLDARATRWALPADLGGEPCARPLLLERYARLAEGSLTAAFILSQHDAAVRRLLAARERPIARHWLEKVAQSQAFTTVGISQLTTSRRHGAQALRASETKPGHYRLDGVMPWVTAAEAADVLVAGAVLDDGRQLLFALPTDRPGLTVPPAFDLAALQASRTTEVACDGVEIDETDLLVDPSPDVMSMPGTAGTGGMETSALALGQALAAVNALLGEAPRRNELAEPVEALGEAWTDLWSALQGAARGDSDAPAPGTLRAQANALVLRTTQAYLTARKGTGFLRSDSAQRWARQALFFLVWSCPGPVAQAAIRDLAGLCPG